MIQVFGSVVIDVVIAMALVFFVFSLVTSGLNEVVAWLLNTRSKVLWQSVRELLDDPISYGFQPLYDAIAKQEGGTTSPYALKVEAAERALRSSRNKETTSEGWATAVDSAMAALQKGPGETDNQTAGDMPGAVRDAADRLKGAYKEPNRLSSFVSLFWQTGTEGRPRSPVVPTIGSVTAIAESVHDGVRSFTDAVYDHPLIRQVDKTGAGKKSKLTWLASGDFSGAALDLIQAAGVERVIEDRWAEAARVLAERIDATQDDVTALFRSSLASVEDRVVMGTANAGVVGAALSNLTTDLVALADSEEGQEAVEDALEGLQTLILDIEPLDLIEQGLEALENIGPVRETMARAAAAARSANTEATNQLAEIKTNIDSWYDGRMESLTVWYRKRSRFIGFALAFFVVVGFNVDAVELPRELWQNEAIRSALVAVAETSELDLAACVEADNGDAVEGSDAAAAKEVTECVEDVEAVVDELIDTGLPVGWVAANDCDGECTAPFETLWYSAGTGDGWLAGLLKLAGWMLAAAALSMGASFWFDVMRRAMGIKAATKNEENDS